MQRAASLAGVVLGVLSGCSLSPRYQRPSVPAPPDSYKEAGAWKLAAPADSTPRGRWWTMFQERELDDLESQVSDANQSLRAALARLDQARAQTRIARSAWFPALTAQANATRSRTSLSSPSYTPGKPAIGNIFTAQGDLSYELDLFGRVRNTVAGARASEQASAGDVAALDLTVRAARAAGGDLPVPELAPGLPSELLERRPDVAAAERRVAAANAAIGVARAAYFPVFSLLGTAGVESSAASNWISAPSRFWSVGPQALMTLFDGGLHAAQSAAAHAAYDEQVANYRGTVLAAFQDVEDNLAALRQLQHESVSQAAAVAATQGALDQANLRYKGGLVTYLEVVSSENAALAARLTAVDISIRRTNATVLLVRALGGDWQPR